MKKDIFSLSEKFEKVCKKAREMFNLWNYREVFLPSVELFNPNLREGLKFAYNNEFYLIKPDLTSQIGTYAKRKKLRVFYISEVLKDGIKGEWQLGAEFIGGKDVFMHIEILMIVISLLESMNIKEFYIDMGSLNVWKNEISSIELENKVFEALRKRNFEIIETLPISKIKKENLWHLFNFRGKDTNYEKLKKIVGIVGDERIFIDFGTVRPLSYYDDIIFEVYSPKLGYSIGGGGDYLINGRKGVGFGFNLKALFSLSQDKEKEKRTIVQGSDTYNMYKRCFSLVKNKIPIEVKDE